MKVKIIVLGAACLIALISLVSHFASSQVTEPLRVNRAAHLFKQALPHLEKVLGYKLPAEPEFRIVSGKELARVPGWEWKAFISWRFPALEKSVRDKAYQIGHYSASAATPARHVEGTKIIMVVPGQTKAIAGWHDSLKAADTDAFLQLALVHEVARMALEKKYQLLNRRHDPHSFDEFQISQALREGRANWITWQVAKRLGSDAQFPLLAKRWLHVPDYAPDPKLKSICQTALRQKHWAYVQGLAFFHFLAESGTRDVEPLVFAKPPRQIAWINDPRLYLRHGVNAGPDLRAILSDVEKKITPANMRCRQQPWTPRMLQQVAALLGEKERAARHTAGWRDGRSLIFSDSQQPGKYIALTVVVFPDSDGARGYYGFAIDMQRKRDEMSAKSPYIQLRTVESQFTPAKIAGTNEAVRNDKVVQVGANGPKSSATVILARSDSFVYEIQWQGRPADMSWSETVIGLVAQCANVIER